MTLAELPNGEYIYIQMKSSSASKLWEGSSTDHLTEEEVFAIEIRYFSIQSTVGWVMSFLTPHRLFMNLY